MTDVIESKIRQVVVNIDGDAIIEDQKGRVLEPSNTRAREGVEIWLEQRIWGHRFYNDQTPWLLLLETMNIIVARAQDLNEKFIFPGIGDLHEAFEYRMQRRSQLRHLLFSDRSINEIADGQSIADSSLWNAWLTRQPNEGKSYEYLRDRFTRFDGFRNAVTLLRGAEIESERDRRPTSRHLAPRGVDMLAADYGESKSGGVNKDRRFFARGGELLFLMLNRSAKRTCLEPLVRSRLAGDSSRWNMLAKALQPSTAETAVVIDNIGYLPLGHHSAYDRIAEDWIATLSLSALPDDSIPELLMRLSGLGVLAYIVARGADILGERAPPFPIDMVSPETLNVQKMSKDCFGRHRDLSRRAIKCLIFTLTSSAEWKAAQLQANPAGALRALVEANFAFEAEETEAAKMAEEIEKTALDKHEERLGKVVGFYAEQIGLAVAKRGSGRWYAASDGMLEAIVLSNVTEPLEFEAFLERLWDRYNFVIGSTIGRREFETANYEHLKMNQRLLEDRLRILGLLKRLSDDCAFVVNPFFRAEEAGR